MFPPGIVFSPDEDVEQVFHYLEKKVRGDNDVERFIRTIKLYDYKPSDLKDLAHDSGHEKLYFFTHHKKFKNGPKIDRQVPGGYWKKTGADVADQVKDGQATVTKTSLAHYTNDQKKTGWLMKEYKLPESQPSKNQDDDEESEKGYPWILCVVYCRTVRKTKRGSNV